MTKLLIGTGDYQITASTVRSELIGSTVILQDLAGWDDLPEKTRNAVKKPNGDGDWVSEYFTWNARNLSITLTTVPSGTEGVTWLRDRVAHWEAQPFVRLEVIRQEGPDLISEVVEGCYSIGRPLWKPIGKRYGSINLALKTPGAFKQRSINGSLPVSVL